MTRPSTHSSSPPVTFVVYTRRPPAATLSTALIRRGHSVLERGFSAVMHELLHDLRPDLIVAALDPSDAEDLGALRQLTLAARDSAILVLSPSLTNSAALPALDLGVDCVLGAESSADIIAAQADALIRHRRDQPGTTE